MKKILLSLVFILFCGFYQIASAQPPPPPPPVQTPIDNQVVILLIAVALFGVYSIKKSKRLVKR